MGTAGRLLGRQHRGLVNQNTAMGVGAFTAGIRLIAETSPDAAHPTNGWSALSGARASAYAMLHDAPNPR